MTDFVVTEGISGTWYYHLSPKAPKPQQRVSLCGATIMHTNIPSDAWGTVTHLNERWCPKCKAIASAVALIAGDSEK